MYYLVLTNIPRYEAIFYKKKAKVVIHRQYNNFRNTYFSKELEHSMLKYDFNSIDYGDFITSSLSWLKCFTKGKILLRESHANFAKQIRKAILKRSTLRVVFSKIESMLTECLQTTTKLI